MDAAAATALQTVEKHPASHLGAAKLLALADKALYEAKRAGRNRVVLAGTARTSRKPRK